MKKNIAYRTFCTNTGQVITGGTFGGSIDSETVERITHLFDVIVKYPGNAVFVDNKGREVSLYFRIDPDTTIKGKQALEQFRAEQRERLEQEESRDRQKEIEILNAMEGLSHTEILRRLKGE